MANKTYRIRIARGDVQFEAEGDKNFVVQMLARFESPAPPAVTATSPTRRAAKGRAAREPVLATARATSPGEFIRQFHFRKHTDFVLAFGHYLEKHSDLNEFSAADINNCYYEAKMESSNTSQMIIQDIKRGYIMEAKGGEKGQKSARKRFTLTRSGEQYLQQALASSADTSAVLRQYAEEKDADHHFERPADGRLWSGPHSKCSSTVYGTSCEATP
jgi:hypothetical protein